jgi:hypothetical protein
MSIERPDSITASAVSARDEIGRAVAQKIREVEDAGELKKVAEDVLPQIEKFLESPEEKRLRRLRAAILVGACGLGTGVLGVIMSAALRGEDAEAALIVCGLGAVAFALGLGMLLNGLFLTKPRKSLDDRSSDAAMQAALEGYARPKLRSSADAQPPLHGQTTSNLSQTPGASVTEHTTHHLKRD